MNFLDILLVLSILLCSLVTGFIFTYAIVVMPGLSKLKDKEFIRAFQVTDEIIQNNQPIFMLIWVGSIISVLSLIISSVIIIGISESLLTIIIGTIYLFGVQGVTIGIHLPLNNQIQKVNTEELDDQKLHEERLNFERKWNFFNNIRTIIAFFITLMFIVILKNN
jgi:uncharacterized membrane protein|tara:strand:+ start:1101 stop:1595 length:495 start_codon:yes stop_codon:yes gene_type:complete